MNGTNQPRWHRGWHSGWHRGWHRRLACDHLKLARATGDLSTRAHRRPAFSLAELMIAVVILGLGLLFIAAALPVGLEYTRQTVDLTTAEAAGQDALNQLELNLRTSQRLYDWSLADAHIAARRLDNIHRPRYQGDATPPNPVRYPLAPKYEPLFKVRPLVVGNVRAEPLSSSAGKSREIFDDAEGTITTFLSSGGGMAQTHPLDFDFDFVASALSLPRNPVLPGLARVYPPIDPVQTFRVFNFFTGSNDAGSENPYPSYAPRSNTLNPNPLQELDRERQKALDGRIAWTVFYRRVAYDEPGSGTPAVFENPNVTSVSNDVLSDPLVYELIIVVTRRPSANYRFPRQDLTASGFDSFEKPVACNPSNPPADDYVSSLGYGIGTDRMAPMPWLVMFDKTATNPLPLMETFPGGPYYDQSDLLARTILAGFAAPATLTFRCTTELGKLLPVGSILIPAFNDNFRRVAGGPNDLNWALLAPGSGFVPHSPHSLPIYEVVERPDPTTVVVKNNGLYPWVVSQNPNDTQAWPVWIIPPAFSQRDSAGQPIYETTSPILKVVRRTVTLRELTP